jgi:hypothetical protein
MSALHPKADMCGATSDVGFGPIADIVARPDEAVAVTLVWISLHLAL